MQPGWFLVGSPGEGRGERQERVCPLGCSPKSMCVRVPVASFPFLTSLKTICRQSTWAGSVSAWDWADAALPRAGFGGGLCSHLTLATGDTLSHRGMLFSALPRSWEHWHRDSHTPLAPHPGGPCYHPPPLYRKKSQCRVSVCAQAVSLDLRSLSRPKAYALGYSP